MRKMPIRGVQTIRRRYKGRLYEYHYHRKTGTRLQAPFGSGEFFAELTALERSTRATPQPAKAGTLGGLIMAYRQSPEYRRLAERTRHDYELVFDYLKPLDARPLIQLDSAGVIRIRDRTLELKKRRFANHTLQVLATILNWGRPRNLAPATNPAAGIPKVPRPRELPPANRPWSYEETKAALDAATGGLRVAIALAVFTGMRGGDIVSVTWAAYDGQNLEWQQRKTGDPVWLPALPELKAILDSAPRTATTIATKQDGTPATEAGLRKAFRTLVLRLLSDRKVEPGLTLHGCRHSLGKDLADLGADPRMIQAVLGQRSMSASLHYSERADRRRAASASVELLAKARRRRQEGER